VLRLTPDERIYRALFLGSIGLLEHGSSPSGAPVYKVPADVAALNNNIWKSAGRIAF
jgi:hypothetical protein